MGLCFYGEVECQAARILAELEELFWVLLLKVGLWRRTTQHDQLEEMDLALQVISWAARFYQGLHFYGEVEYQVTRILAVEEEWYWQREMDQTIQECL